MRIFALALVLGAASGQAQPLAEVVVHEDDGWFRYEYANDEVFVGCSLGCALGWTLQASSHLAPQGANRYDVSGLEDGSARTAWVEGVAGDGIGETLTFRFEDAPEGAEVYDIPFRGLAVVNGYAKTGAAWRANGRVRGLVVRVNGETVARAELADSMFPQSVRFSEAVGVRPGDVVTLEIASVYAGDRYDDTAISEITLDGAH